MGWGKYLGLLGGIGGGLATGAIGKHGIDPRMLSMIGGIGGMALGGALGGHGHGGGNPNNMGQIPQGAGPGQPMPQAMPGQMSAGPSPMQPVQMGQAAPPTSFGQAPGMFGGADPRQAMMQKYRQWQMLNGGGY